MDLDPKLCQQYVQCFQGELQHRIRPTPLNWRREFPEHGSVFANTHRDPVPVGRVEKFKLLFEDGQEFLLLAYHPADPPKPCPVGIFVHGGGGLYGDEESGSAFIRVACRVLKSICVSVGYPIANPAREVEAVKRTIEYAISDKGKEQFNTDPARLWVDGISSGASSAIVATGLTTVPVRFLSLRVPIINWSEEARNRISPNIRPPIFNEERFEFYGRHNGWRTAVEGIKPTAAFSPGNRWQKPPTLVVVAEVDPWMRQGLELVEELKRFPVPVVEKRIPNLPHELFELSGRLYETRKAIREICEEIGRALE